MNYSRVFIMVAVLAASSGSLHANEGERISACMSEASEKYSIHPYLLWAIAKTESSFNSRAVGNNKNGSYDIGIMQINSMWLPKLRKYGISEQKLLDPCVNIDVGSWILANNFKTMGQNWRAVGAYNATTEWKRMRYAAKVEKNLAIAYKLSEKQAKGNNEKTQTKPPMVAMTEQPNSKGENQPTLRVIQ